MQLGSMQEILSNVDFEVPVGARAVIVGPNGCGKTTLLTTIANRDSVEGLCRSFVMERAVAAIKRH